MTAFLAREKSGANTSHRDQTAQTCAPGCSDAELEGNDDTHMWDAEWSRKAACRDTDPDVLFVQGAAQNRVKVICANCTVRTECLADALDNNIEFGVWGGMTERERRALLRRRPNVASWRELLMSARKDYDSLDPVAFVRGA